MENNSINKHNANQIEIIKLLKQTAKEILSDDKIRKKVKPTLLSNFTNKLIQLIKEIEEIEKMDLRLLEKNVEQFQKKNPSRQTNTPQRTKSTRSNFLFIFLYTRQ